MYCVWCDEEILLELNWRRFFKVSTSKYLCQECRLKLDLIEGNSCQKCSKLTDMTICQDCQIWLNMDWQQFGPSLTADPLEFNVSVFSYNDFMKELIAKWKYRGDYELVKAFQHDFISTFNRQFLEFSSEAVLVPIPLSKERSLERGFNQSLSLAQLLPLTVKEILSRQHGEKQAKKSRHERMSTDNPFIIEETINKTVILVDDIYTTGTTLRHAASLLKRHGCPKVFAYTLIRG